MTPLQRLAILTAAAAVAVAIYLIQRFVIPRLDGVGRELPVARKAEPPICIDCRFFEQTPPNMPYTDGKRCHRLKDVTVPTRDPVTGAMHPYETLLPAAERGETWGKLGGCGPSGKYFQPKETT